MKKRFSSQELFEIRNTIPVEMLIKNQLQMSSKTSDGLFRFLCPLCSGYHTAVNPVKNLARCFSCLKNFNTIDLVMAVKKWGFRESTLFLKSVLQHTYTRNAHILLRDQTTAPGRPVQTKPEGTNSGLDHKSGHGAEGLMSRGPRTSGFGQSCDQAPNSSCDRRRNPETVRRIFEKMFLEGQNNS